MRKNKAKSNQSSDQDPVLIELTKKSAAVWLVILCFVSAWIFLLGILVGRGTAPVQFDIHALQKELSELRLAIIEKEQKLITDFDFHEALKKSMPDTNLKLKLETPQTASEKPRPSEEEQSIPIKKQSVKIVKKPDKDESEPKEDSEATDKMLTIQVASLRDPKLADQMVSALKKKGYPAYKTIGIISEDNIWYRIRVGYYKTKTDSQKMMGELKKEYKGAILVNR
jgi:cell division septation protein DedD